MFFKLPFRKSIIIVVCFGLFASSPFSPELALKIARIQKNKIDEEASRLMRPLGVYRKYPSTIPPSAQWFAHQRSADLSAEIDNLLNSAEPKDAALSQFMSQFISQFCTNVGTRFGADFAETETARMDVSSRSRQLQTDTLRRCGDLAVLQRRPVPNTTTTARTKAHENPRGNAAHSSSMMLNEVTPDSQLNMVRSILSDANWASIWAVDNSEWLTSLAKREGHTQGLNVQQANAVVWLAICDFGADCADHGFGRLQACFQAGICAGDSVEEGVADKFPVAILSVLRERADRLGSQLSAGTPAI